MRLPDVNVLVYAHRADDPSHRAYRTWLESLASGPGLFALSGLAAVGFLRVVTNPRVFQPPTPTAQALSVIEALAGRPNCRVIQPGERHLTLTCKLVRDVGATGKLIADAQHAALAIEHGCEWVTRDGDFARFVPHGLRWHHLVL